MATEKYDLVVIGGGPGGYVAAVRAAQLGFKVACVEKEKQMGGTCLRIGCIPSKALLESSARFHDTKSNLAIHGIQVESVNLDLAAMMDRKDQIVSNLDKGIQGLFKKHKITRITGHGRLTQDGSVVVNDDENSQIKPTHILIATGSRPSTLPGIELDEKWIGSNTAALSYKKPPAKLLVIGGGYIGLELGSVWNRLGSEVHVLEYLDRILPGMDSELAGEALKLFKKQGLHFRLGAKVKSAEHSGDQCQVRLDGDEVLEGDRVLVAVGRKPNTEGLGLADAGIETDDKGRIKVDKNYQTNVKGVYAIGDVIDGPMLAHKAEADGVAFAEKLAGHIAHVDYDLIPAVVYTHPEIACVGKTEDQLKEDKVDYKKGKYYFRANGRAYTLDDTDGFVKILADAWTDRILGVHIIGPRAGDILSEAAVAMNFGASSEDLAMSWHAHPTLSEALKEAAASVSH